MTKIDVKLSWGREVVFCAPKNSDELAGNFDS